MDIKSEKLLMYRCNSCNKKYSSASSLCNHNKRKHINNNPNVLQPYSKCIPNVFQLYSNC